MADCRHDWRTIAYGPIGSGAIEQVCPSCGGRRFIGQPREIELMAYSRGLDVKFDDRRVCGESR